MEEKSVFAGIEPGGIADKHQVRVLICYLIVSVELPLTGQQMYEIFAKDDLVNYFAFMEAFYELLDVQDILLVPEDAELVSGDLDARYCCSPHGEQTAKTLADTLPKSVRDRVYENAAILLEKVRPKYTSDVTVTKENGQYRIDFEMQRDGEGVFNMNFYLRSKRDAALAEQKLTETPFACCDEIIKLLIG